MGKINVNGKVITFTAADATNNIIKADGKYYEKGPKGYREIKENGESIFNAAAKKSAEAKKKAQAAANYNKKNGFEPNKKYYVVGNSSYFTMVDNNYNTLYYKDNQRITKEQFQKGANCVYDAKSKRYIARDAKNVSHKYAAQFRQTVKDSKTGRYFVEIKGGQRKYFEANGKEISERAFLDIEKAYIDSDGKIAKYDWWAKTKNAASGIGNMFADMVTEEVTVDQKDKNGSSKTTRNFSLKRTLRTVGVGVAIAGACILAAPLAAAGAAAVGIGAGAAATIGTVAGLTTQLGIAGYFGYEGGKQMYNANEENKNVLLSNNERMENWKKKGAGGAQVGMSLMMVKGAVKNAPKTHATARNTAKAIETKNNATLMAKGKVGLRDRISNARSGFSETVGWKALKKGVGDYHKNNSLKTKVADVAKAPLKLTKEAVMEPVRLVRGTLRGGARLVTKKGRVEIKGDIKEWKNSFKENPQGTPALNPEQVKAQQEANTEFKQTLAKMSKDNKVQQYESLIEKTTDKNQVAQLLDAIKNDKDLTKAEKAEVATKFFEKNDAQYPGVLDAGKRQKAELGLDKAKTLEDLNKVDKKALPAKKQKVFDKKKAEFEKKNSQKVKSVIKDINKIKEPAKLDVKIEELSNEKFFNKVSEAQANEVRSAIRKRQAEIETSGIKEANENAAVKKKQNVYTRVKNWWNSQKVKSVIKDINNIKEPAKLDAKIEELSNEKFFDKVSEAQANEVRSAIRKRQAEIETSGIKEANENAAVKKKQNVYTRVKNWWNSQKVKSVIKDINNIKEPAKLDAKIEELSNKKFFDKVSEVQANEVRSAIRKRQAEIETPGIKEANENSIGKKQKLDEHKSQNSENSVAKFEEMIAKSDDMSQVRAKLSNNLEFNKLSQAEQRQLIAKINQREIEIVDMKNTFAKFEDMIAKADDLSKVQAKLSNNPEFNKLSKADKLKLLEKLNKRNAELEAAAKTEDNISLTQKVTTRTKKYTTPQNESAFEKATRNCNNPNEVAPPRTVRLGKEKFNEAKQNLIDALDDITTIDDPQIGILEKRINSLQIRSQRRTLQELLDKKKADLTNAKLQSDVSPQTKTPNSENSFAKFEDMIAKSDDMSQVRAKLSNNLEFNKLSQAEQRQLIAKINQREIEIVDMKNTFAKFEDMIAKADDLSKVQAKLSNNPEFNKLSNADKLKLLKKLNQRKVELEAAASKSAQKEAPKNEPKTSKTGYSNNLFDNVKDMKTPTLGGLNAVKSVDENVVKPLEDALNSTLDPNQQYAAEPTVQEDYIEEESSEVDSENEVAEEPPVQESGDQEEVANPEDNSDVENPEESGDADETNPDDASNNIKDSEEAPASEPEQETEAPVTEPQTPATEQKDGENAPAPSTPTTPTAPSAQDNSGNVKDTTTPKANTPDGNIKGDSSVAPEQPAPAQSDKANDSKKVEDSKNDTVGQVGGEKKNGNVVQENGQEERDIPQNKKLEITKKVQEANTDEDIGNVLRELREVGRFKGRKNLRRLLKAKRKYNKELAENDVKKADKYQERVEKYQERVKDNINEINEAYRKKLED